MLRRQSKPLSIALIFVFCMSFMFAGFAAPDSASAATTNLITSTSAFDGNAGNQNLGQVWIYENTDQAGSVFFDTTAVPGIQYDITVTILTSGVEFQAAPTAGTVGTFVAPLVTIPVGTNKIVAGDITLLGTGTTKTYTIRVTPSTAAGTRSGLQFMFPVNIAGASAGPIEVEITAPDTGITSGKFTVGQIAGTGTQTVVLDTATVQNGAVGSACGLLRIQESVVDSLAAGTQVRLDLPANMTWNAATVVTPVGLTIATPAGTTPVAGGNAGISTNSAGNSRLSFNVTANPAGGSREIITITPSIDVDDFASAGDITISVSGNNSNVTSADVVIGKVADFGIKVEAIGDPAIIVPGVIDVPAGGFKIIESVNGSLLGGRSVLMELPSYVRWFTDPSMTTEKGTAALLATVPNNTIDDSRNTKKYTVAPAGSASATTIKFDRIRLIVDADAPEGPVEVKFSGTAGATGSVVIANVVKSLKTEGGSNKVIIGAANQKASDFTITEVAKGIMHGNPTLLNWATTSKTALGINANQQGWLNIIAPPGVTFTKAPTVSVEEGNIKVEKDSIRLNAGKNVVQIRVNVASTAPSKLKVSDVYLTVDRTVPVGDLKFDISGTSVDRSSRANDVAVATVKVADVITPAPDQGTEGAVTGQFRIDSNIYEVNGVSKIMDAVPYIKAGRTYVPVRYLAYALGVAEADVVWDEATQKVTMTKGDNKVELTIGSTTYAINGEAKTMDVAPEINNGRTMLPARYVAEGFGYAVGWDPGTRTVLISK
ncbi:Copper amine oxidase-like, N-terminal [Syntrophomonas zehnderi OL-4]|uniref:Copper amine oxidase-like, N-terminal n=1 Tax=Syntrophomonas zehnderi OL-4 TaxID=690567 RepID=A0A0E4C7S3_9FIRM|nr:copper amine oxidase N-terminal domain-containing protein [Syntrophomonas zehnderi]CFX11875.1 Copper amine oxidase-like, N-terminal [Syntrophomonas zehnderi OL-4]